ncbi:NAD(P)-binding protein [Suillus clintonianus]|uniref:NAD(P)-binding protein n=1 Tax=Suillus clintonianus TaxID=1904413 RepID=UPI001B86C427|nr:NAD(P)-binding protein [Suillus clintonianus]KAG2116841.1 NAD(P)-binding protein [Suillus clintonianus]
MAESKVWLVTGSSSGFGRSMTEFLLKNGNKVVATLRRIEALSDLAKQYPSSQLLIVQMDVVKSSEVTTAFAKAKEVFGGVDVVFNNAGTSIVGEVESMSDQDARQMFEVNFWGVSNVTREAIRTFREVNKPTGGRLLQVSSTLGLVGRPAMSYYSASKHALEGFSESIAQELDPAWNIKVTILEPGPFRTRMFEDSMQPSPQHPAYANPELGGSKFRKWLASAVADGDTEKAVVVIEKVTHLDEPPLRLPLHRGTVKAVRDKAKNLTDTMDTYESWTENVYFT